MAKARVLVVEDDTHLLGGIRDILEMYDYSVVTAENGVEALQLLQEHPQQPDIIVSDIMMPEMDGFQFLQEVRKVEDWVTIPFIFLTAKGERGDILRGRKLGVDVYLTKPFDPEDLLVAVRARLERKEQFEKAKSREIEEIKQDILSVLNHEFRTPLTLIVAYADMVKEYEQTQISDSELGSFIRGVSAGANRLRRLVENFILLVELDSGEMQQNFSWRKRGVNILDVIEAAKQQVFEESSVVQDYAAEGVAYTCELEVVEPLPMIEADREYLTVAIRELLHNAVKFSQADHPIELGVRADDSALYIWVSDHGRGIPQEHLDKIWQRFYQVDRKYHEDQGGGVGLTIAKGVVEMHGGNIYVESIEGEGSTFTIQLPLPSEN